MKDKIIIICFAAIAFLIVVVGVSKMADKPIVFESAYLALYDGLPYYQYNHGYASLNDDQLVYFLAYKCFDKAVVVFKLEKEGPVFSMIYLQDPGIPEFKRGWIDDNCDGKFRLMNVEDEAVVPECYKED